jgi:exosortase
MADLAREACATLRHRQAVPVAVLSGLLLWGYWPSLSEMFTKWRHDAHYTHGFLVPIFAGILLWLRRSQVPALLPRPSWWGVLLLGGAALFRLAGTYFYLSWVEDVSLLPALAGICVLFGGWAALRWAWPAIAFLFFMLPLPYRLESALAGPLQSLATEVSTYTLQTLGYCAVAENNVIHMREVTISVVQACSGLSMLLTSAAVATAVVLAFRLPLWQRAVILLSAGPVALITNAARITAMGILSKLLGPTAADEYFHGPVGLLMLPLAMALLWLELKLFSWLLLEPAEDEGPAPAAPLAPLSSRRHAGERVLAHQKSG